MKQQSGFALLVVMSLFLVIVGFAGYWLSRSGNFLEISKAKSRKEVLVVQGKSRLLEIQEGTRKIVNDAIDAFKQGQAGISTPYPFEEIALEEGEKLILSCVAQGTNREPCNRDDKKVPKIINFKFTRRAPSSTETVMMTGEFQADFTRLNDFAYLIINQPGTSLTVGSNTFDGKFGVFFNNVVEGPLTSASTTRLQFANKATEDLIFKKVVMMNIPINQIDQGLPYTYDPLVYWYPIKKPQLERGIYASAAPPTDIYQSFSALATAAETLKYDGYTFPIEQAIIKLGGPSNPCGIEISLYHSDETCETGGTQIDKRDYQYFPDQRLKQSPKEKTGVASELFASLWNTFQFSLFATPGGPIPNEMQFTESCDSTRSWHTWPGISNQTDLAGKVLRIKSATPIVVTDLNDSAAARYASVCENFTIISESPITFSKSILRKAVGGPAPEDKANVAFVNLGGSNTIDGNTIPLAPTSANNLNQLKDICDTMQGQNCSGTNFNPSQDLSMNLEVSLLAFSSSQNPEAGASALFVPPSLIDINNPGVMGGLQVKGLFVADRMTPNKSISPQGYPPSPNILVSGFSFTKFSYPPALQYYPPPGILAASSNLAINVSLTGLEISVSDIKEANLWAASSP